MSIASRYAALSKGPLYSLQILESKVHTICPANQNVPRKESTGDNLPVAERAPQDLLEGILHHKPATATLSTVVDALHNE
jgi:hypothetical protein